MPVSNADSGSPNPAARKRRDGGAGVVDLMAAAELRQRQIEQPVVVLIDQPAVLVVHVPVLAGDAERRAPAPRRLLDHRQHRVALRRNRRRHAALEDRGLLVGDLLDGVAEEFQMIHRDRRDRAGDRLVDHVGRVEPAAETDFEQRDVGGRAREQQERRRGLDLEHGDRLVAVGALAFAQHAGERFVADELAAARRADAKALVEAHEMRRGVDVNALARRLQHGAHEGDGRALAVGAGDMDDRRHLPLRMVELVEQAPHPVEREIDPLRMQRQQPRDDGFVDAHALARAARRSRPARSRFRARRAAAP